GRDRVELDRAAVDGERAAAEAAAGGDHQVAGGQVDPAGEVVGPAQADLAAGVQAPGAGLVDEQPAGRRFVDGQHVRRHAAPQLQSPDAAAEDLQRRTVERD